MSSSAKLGNSTLGQDHEMDEDDDERPPICPACGVTMGMVAEGAETRFVCWECGFGEAASPRVVGE